MAVKVLLCTCEHAYQDEKYGNGKRIHNKAPKVDLQTGYRCTVCGATKK